VPFPRGHLRLHSLPSTTTGLTHQTALPTVPHQSEYAPSASENFDCFLNNCSPAFDGLSCDPVNECNGDLSPIETIAHPLAARITSCLPTNRTETRANEIERRAGKARTRYDIEASMASLEPEQRHLARHGTLQRHVDPNRASAGSIWRPRDVKSCN